MNMNARQLTRNIFRIVAVAVILATSSVAQTVERIALPADGLSDAIRQSVETKGYRVKLNDGWTAEFWFAQRLAVGEKNVPGALYPEPEAGSFVGIVKLGQETTDYRGQTIRPGIYSLRYELLPQDGNHLGVAPDPDFLLAIPIAEEQNPVQPLVARKVVQMSSKTTGGAHPAVFALDNAGEPGTVGKAESGTVFSIAIPAGNKPERLGICLTCSASQ